MAASPQNKFQQHYRVPTDEEVAPAMARVRATLDVEADDSDLPEGTPLDDEEDDLDVTAVFLR